MFCKINCHDFLLKIFPWAVEVKLCTMCLYKTHLLKAIIKGLDQLNPGKIRLKIKGLDQLNPGQIRLKTGPIWFNTGQAIVQPHLICDEDKKQRTTLITITSVVPLQWPIDGLWDIRRILWLKKISHKFRKCYLFVNTYRICFTLQSFVSKYQKPNTYFLIFYAIKVYFCLQFKTNYYRNHLYRGL